jgi:SAM-dependent methyltransferase
MLSRSVFSFPNPPSPMRADGERYVSGILGDIQSEHYHRYLFALSYCTGKDVLDVASGEGYGSACLGQVARSVVGVDASPEAVEFANSNYLNDHVSFKRGLAQKLPIEGQSIDVVVSFETLEHLAEHDLFCREIRRVLRPGGLLIISSPNRPVYTEEANHHNKFHVRELDRDELVALLDAHFPNVVLFSQRPLVGSVIANENDAAPCRPEGFILQSSGVFERTSGTPHPPYFVAVASDAMLPPIRASILHNPALLHHIDELHRHAANELVQRTAQVIQIYHPLCEGYLEEKSQNVPIRINEWQHVTIELPLGLQHGPLRIDLSNCPALIDLRGITIRSAFDHQILWTANGSDLRTMTAGGTLTQLGPELSNGACRFFSYGFDPQLYLPRLDSEVFDQPVSLEIWVRLQTDLADLLSVLQNGNGESAKLLAEKDQALQQFPDLTAQMDGLRTERDQLLKEIDKKQTQLYLLGDCAAEAKKTEAAYGELERKHTALEKSYGELSKELSKSSEERDGLQLTLAEVLSSRSWRLTAPLRRAMSLLEHK